MTRTSHRSATRPRAQFSFSHAAETPRRAAADCAEGYSRGRLRSTLVGLCGALAVGLTGCAAPAYFQIAAARTVRAASANVRVGVDEYQADVEVADDEREDAVIDALAARVQQDPANAAAHVAATKKAIAKINADRKAASARYAATGESLTALDEVADGLESMGKRMLTLDDEMAIYLANWSNAAAGGGRDARPTRSARAPLSPEKP